MAAQKVVTPESLWAPVTLPARRLLALSPLFWDSVSLASRLGALTGGLMVLKFGSPFCCSLLSLPCHGPLGVPIWGYCE